MQDNELITVPRETIEKLADIINNRRLDLVDNHPGDPGLEKMALDMKNWADVLADIANLQRVYLKIEN
ncbi:hypothetical protein O0Z71_05285 [Ligilactobacillus saerimneri]|uniref:hypothetical protein n=1 Tax=Ligilactobacillus saerimneri TaxID=228229 RepID=UPI0022A79392|nr:hypothetical protein [Ligilactobacillus saerimneri]MCZ0891852.1 hypothetical protein [Ligilactobacillus saerimneri]